jgi:hypothetical protein
MRPRVLEARVLDHEAFAVACHFPNKIDFATKVANERESCKPQGRSLAVDSGQDEAEPASSGRSSQRSLAAAKGSPKLCASATAAFEGRRVSEAALECMRPPVRNPANADKVNRPRREQATRSRGTATERACVHQWAP